MSIRNAVARPGSEKRARKTRRAKQRRLTAPGRRCMLKPSSTPRARIRRELRVFHRPGSRGYHNNHECADVGEEATSENRAVLSSPLSFPTSKIAPRSAIIPALGNEISGMCDSALPCLCLFFLCVSSACVIEEVRHKLVEIGAVKLFSGVATFHRNNKIFSSVRRLMIRAKFH